MEENTPPAPSLEAISPKPSSKVLGKRPMTSAQLEVEYAKIHRVEYDSDDEPIKCHPMRMSNIAIPMTAPENKIVDLTEALLYSNDIDDIYDDAVQAVEFDPAYSPLHTGANPDSMVQDPFNQNARCTLKERDEILHDEQEYRESHGMPLLIRDPYDHEHWIDPWEIDELRPDADPDSVVVKLEVDAEDKAD